MRAWVARQWGTPDTLQLEEFDPGDAPADQVRIRVHAAAVNFGDSLLVAGTYQVRPDFPFIPGMEVAGEVITAPPGTGFAAGDRVMAVVESQGLRSGAYAEATDARPGATFRIPDAMPYTDAACFIVAYQTGHFGLHRRARLARGETLLVHGGAGGVGSAAIQLGRAAGARVFATAGSADKAEVCRALGAEVAINYREEDFVEVVNRATGGRGADVVYDPIGGDVFERSTKCIAFEGRIVVVGFASGRVPEVRANHVLVKNYSVLGLHWGLYNRVAPELIGPAMDTLLELYRDGVAVPHISATWPLNRAPEALAAVAGGGTTGKVALITEDSA
ncbi:MAG: NADPH:quinone oxidoreductase family protein [Candidatus Dormibacteria bacterium]